MTDKSAGAVRREPARLSVEDKARLLSALEDRISTAVTNKRWIYWPPGPMMGQIFDREQMKKDIAAILDKFVEAA